VIDAGRWVWGQGNRVQRKRVTRGDCRLHPIWSTYLTVENHYFPLKSEKSVEKRSKRTGSCARSALDFEMSLVNRRPPGRRSGSSGVRHREGRKHLTRGKIDMPVRIAGRI